MGREHTQGLRAFLRRSGDDLDAVLRSSRPVAPSAFVDELVGRVSNGAPVRARPLQLLLAVVATSVMLVVFAGFGGIGYAASAARQVAQTVTATATGNPPADKKAKAPDPVASSGGGGNSGGGNGNSGGGNSGGNGNGNSGGGNSNSGGGNSGGGNGNSGGGNNGNGNGNGGNGGGNDNNGGGNGNGGGNDDDNGDDEDEEEPDDAGSAQYSTKVSICHATGSSTNPYVLITVSSNAVPAHRRHQNGEDIIPAPPTGCPTTAP